MLIDHINSEEKKSEDLSDNKENDLHDILIDSPSPVFLNYKVDDEKIESDPLNDTPVLIRKYPPPLDKVEKSNFGKIFEENKLVDAIDLLIKNGEIEDDKISIIRTLIKNRVHILNEQFVDYVTFQENCTMIDQFLESEINYYNLDLDIAIRRTIYLFGNLPIEGQRIGRILKSLSNLYFKQNPSCGFKSADSVFGLTNSILLLNPILHLKLENRKMMPEFTLKNWIENNQGKNDGEDFDPQLLEEVFVHVRDDEIKLLKDEKFPAAVKKGWLLCREKNSTFRNWKKRWCIIENNIFHEMRNPQSSVYKSYPLNTSFACELLRDDDVYQISLRYDGSPSTNKKNSSNKMQRIYKSTHNNSTKRWYKIFMRSKLLCDRSSYIMKLRESFRISDDDNRTKNTSN